MEYYSLHDTVKYATDFQASDWLYFLQHGININVNAIIFLSSSFLITFGTLFNQKTINTNNTYEKNGFDVCSA